MKAETRKGIGDFLVCDIYSEDTAVDSLEEFRGMLETAMVLSDSRSVMANKEVFGTRFYALDTGLMVEALNMLKDYGFRLAIYGEFGEMYLDKYLAFLGEDTTGVDYIYFTRDEEGAMEMLERAGRPLGNNV